MEFNITKSAIVVAHPGHEIRLHGWLERERPLVFVLTDGTGRAGTSRIDSTAEYLKKFGMKRGCVFARYTDLEVYRLVLAGDFDAFLALSDELAEAFVAASVCCVVSDASEDYNSTHEVLRLVANTAVETARRMSGCEISNYDFPVVQRPDHCPEELRSRSIWLSLDDETFARKISAAFEFYPQLVAEMRDMLEGKGDKEFVERFRLKDDSQAASCLAGLEMFRVECLRPVLPDAIRAESGKPFYESHGEQKVLEGVYEDVIRYREHIAPLAAALNNHVKRKS